MPLVERGLEHWQSVEQTGKEFLIQILPHRDFGWFLF